MRERLEKPPKICINSFNIAVEQDEEPFLYDALTEGKLPDFADLYKMILVVCLTVGLG